MLMLAAVAAPAAASGLAAAGCCYYCMSFSHFSMASLPDGIIAHGGRQQSSRKLQHEWHQVRQPLLR